LSYDKDFNTTPNERQKNTYFYTGGRLFIIVQSVESSPKYWISSGKIRSIEDLQNSTLIVTLENFFVMGDRKALEKIRSRFMLRKITLNMTDGRYFEIGAAAFTPSVMQSEPRYLYRFPSDEEQFPKPRMIGLTCDELLNSSSDGK
jgi:hypothetical protein